MKVFSKFALCLATLALPMAAQSGAQLKQELRAKEAAAKKDPDALFEAGKWAAEKSLAAEAKRIYQAVLKIKADHEGANTALGNELVEGKWMPAKEAEALRRKAVAAELAAKGFVEVSGVWVEKEQADDAKRGIFHHEKETVTKEEKLALQSGKVRHPETGELIDPKHLEQAAKKYYPVGAQGRWTDEKEADTFHSDTKRPWIVRTSYCVLVSTLPIAKLQALRTEADFAIEKVAPLLGSPTLHPKNRPIVLVAATDSEYSEMGTGLGDETSSHGACLMREEAQIEVPPYGEVRGAMCLNHKDWGLRYVRHAAALAYVHGASAELGEDLPLWLMTGIAGYTSRMHNEVDAAHFGKLHIAKGGVRNLKGFFAGFAINGEMQSTEIDANIYQAALLIHFAAHGGETKITEMLQELSGSLSGAKKGGVGKILARFQAALIEAEPKIVAYLQKISG